MAIERAILSVSDKRGIVELAKALRERGVEILSTGGTAKHLADAGVDVTPISKWSGAPEILGGRVKTLTPKVFGGILFDRDNPSHVAEGLAPIDLVVVNLYPFEATIAKEGVTIDEAIEQIDVGGPSMLRAAAKNHRHVLPLCDPSLYQEFLAQIDEISDDFRRRCAAAVFERTSAYDGAIARFLAGVAAAAPAAGGRERPPLHLRYGENPHQSAEFRFADKPFEQLQGKELSYNNILDLDSAIRLAYGFREPAAAVIKHTNPCGAARRDSLAEALRAAIASDPVSAFGGIIGANREFDEESARIVESIFLEVIVAPSFSDGARAVLAKKKQLRLIAAAAPANEQELRSAAGGVLVQSVDRVSGRDGWRVVTETQPDDLDGLEFAWIVCAHVKSNAIVLCCDSQTAGVGAGQMSRVDAAKVAIMKSLLPTAGSVAASDAFFPFRDGLDILADAGVRAVIQPGGSMRDEEVIAAANERGLAMVFTGERHFRH
jgi:phosphoribosylaminoimidazolecarboxamide formyltransferase/IMP cyclohydrolase